FPANTRLGSQFVTPVYPNGQVGTTPLSTGLFTVQPGATFTLIYDVTTYAPGGGSLNFADTLVPTANPFTDAGDVPVIEIVAVGPSAPAAPAATVIALAPASSTQAVGTTSTLEAAVTGAGAVAVPEAPVLFTVLTGPNAGTTGTVLTGDDGKAQFSY